MIYLKYFEDLDNDLSDNIDILIAKKRIVSEAKNRTTFVTSGYGGKFFSISRSEILQESEGSIKINDISSESCKKYKISKQTYIKYIKFFDRMSKYDFKKLG